VKVTLRLKLHIDPATQKALKETLLQFTDCFNAVCRYGWDNNERNGTRLHRATYKSLRKAHPDLPAQLVVSARMKATEALKSVAERKKQGRSVTCPQSALCPVRYDARSYWVRLQDGCASLATTQGRVCVPFRLCDYYTRYAHWKPCSADLCFRDGAFSLHVVVEAESPEPVCEGVLGVDLGIVELATDSNGNTYSGEAVKAVRCRLKRLRSLLQKRGTKSAKRHLKKIRAEQSRFVKNTNHVVSKTLVRSAVQSRKALALEDLRCLEQKRFLARCDGSSVTGRSCNCVNLSPIKRRRQECLLCWLTRVTRLAPVLYADIARERTAKARAGSTVNSVALRRMLISMRR